MRNKQQGFLLLTVAILIVLLSVVSTVVVQTLVSNLSVGGDELNSLQAFYLAQAGLQRGQRVLLTTTPSDLSARVACNAISGDSGFTNLNFAGGIITITATLFPSSSFTTLTSAISAATTTLNVSSTSGYASRGRIRIDRETIAYTGVTPTSFTGATRGADGTAALSHAFGTPVGQNQCQVTSIAGIPNLSSSALARRELSVNNIQLRTAWAVGAASGGENLNQWNNATWTRYPTSGAIPNTQLNGISLLSQADGWAVGNNALFLRWNGVSWTQVSPAGGFPNVRMNSVFCNSRNNCHAAGNNNGGRGMLAIYNGVNWTRATDDGSLASQNFWGIHCTGTNDCWAVGNNGNGNANIARWNGTTWTRNTGLLDSTGADAVPNVDLEAVFCNSTTDCWAVGDPSGGSPTIVHWDGIEWELETSIDTTGSDAVPSAILRSVYCNSTNDCWIVGDNQGGQALVIHWDGSIWRRAAVGTLPNTDLNDISCDASNACWVVGDNSGGETIGFWNGSTWSRIGPVASVANANLFAVDSIGPVSQPTFIWSDTIV
ncbi:MAG: hypothetical protein Tsb005_11140 [Gammaproteobacteria bacterium]